MMMRIGRSEKGLKYQGNKKMQDDAHTEVCRVLARTSQGKMGSAIYSVVSSCLFVWPLSSGLNGAIQASSIAACAETQPRRVMYVSY